MRTFKIIGVFFSLFIVFFESNAQVYSAPSSAGTGGFYNTFLGPFAGNNSLDGNNINNTAVGYGAGTDNISGNGNTFLGSLAGRSTTSGSLNTFVGMNAGFANTTGGTNVFVGSRAGRANTTGLDNVFVGFQIGHNNTVGKYNSFYGNYAGSGNISGEWNTFLGINAGYNNTTGTKNTFVGNNSGVGVTTGVANTVIGAAGSLSATLFRSIILADGDGIQRFYINSNGYTGIDLGNNIIPANRLEINTTGAVTGTLGLRFKNFTNSNFNTLTASTSKKVLSVNTSGDVILVDDMVGTGSSGITSTCATGNFITKSDGTSGNIKCSEIYDDGAKHVGFFYGSSPLTSVNVSINGTLATTGIYNTSDKKFKTDIKPIESALEKIMQLEGKTYNWKKEAFKENNFSNELQYGLLAQDVQKVIPSLVIAADNGDLAMNYNGLIPVLIEALKEQQNQIADLKSQLSDRFQKQNQDLIALTNTKIISVSPNPSNDVISVSLNVERSVTNAKLVVYDLKGSILSSLQINDRENNITKTLQKDNFGKGVYIISLLINGKSIDSKKIIFN